ncbi:hypothetical protein PAXINDRAFT_157254 [Paxillus involutus ATCC 200175]|uniref:P-type phospholipid transporter n=1 Tax=Paxillus involutus ATCC 200175 TaxID=664439 RepID=A0A0C9SSX5_PAXIN|nr:hypothetical protein PAXINDRAFT_157254 [Paxillus involutus ATCC 200175]
MISYPSAQTRKPKSVFVNIHGQSAEYEILDVCEFNSTRKRMSTVVRTPDGTIKLYCKGADTVILERLGKNQLFTEKTLAHLEDYATEGLRTLCIAYRDIPAAEYAQWATIYSQAASTINGRSEALDQAAELIEKDLFLLGATAVEDKLQEGVPDTIHTLQMAGIKIWVLTGDRQETAINIGMSCRLIAESMNMVIVNEETAHDTAEFISRRLTAIKNQRSSGEQEDLALVIDGKSLTFALEKDLSKSFLELALLCKAVICCRVSPLQKALVVKLVKKNQNSILLAIGDGANDVSRVWNYRRTYMPRSYHIAQELQKYNIPDYRPRQEQFQKAIKKVRAVQRMRRNRGFAFSQTENGQQDQTKVIRAYDTSKSSARPSGY